MKSPVPFDSVPFVVITTLLSTGAGIVSWSYNAFQTQAAAQNYSTQIDKRLDRIENKLDRLVEHMR